MKNNTVPLEDWGVTESLFGTGRILLYRKEFSCFTVSSQKFHHKNVLLQIDEHKVKYKANAQTAQILFWIRILKLQNVKRNV